MGNQSGDSEGAIQVTLDLDLEEEEPIRAEETVSQCVISTVTTFGNAGSMVD